MAKNKTVWNHEDEDFEFGGLTNDERAEMVTASLLAFASESGQDIEKEKAEIVSDLMADLMHYCRREEIDFDYALKFAKSNHAAEARFEE